MKNKQHRWCVCTIETAKMEAEFILMRIHSVFRKYNSQIETI